MTLFALTVDTEADNQWDHGRPLTTDNVRYWEPFQAICARYEISPTYLVTSEIVADPSARDKLASWVAEGRAEVGAHLHAWTTPPFLDRPGSRYNDPVHAYLPEFPEETIRAKLEQLTGEIAGAVASRPTSFRGGRFGFDARCARVLAELGYLVDSSVTPMCRWDYPGMPGGSGGPDYSQLDTRPFVIEGTGTPGLIEIPITIMPSYRLLDRSALWLRMYRSWAFRAVRRATLSRWLPPQPVWLQLVPDYRIKDLARVFSRQSQMADVAVMMLHSSDLMPGASPYRPDTAAVQDLLRVLDAFLGLVREAGGVSATLSEAALALRSTKTLTVRAL